MRTKAKSIGSESDPQAGTPIRHAERPGSSALRDGRQRMTLPAASLLCATATGLLASASAARGQSDVPEDDWTVVSAEASEIEAVGPNVGTQPKPPRPVTPAPALEGEGESSRFHAAFGVDYTTSYLGRGLYCEDSGLILQPYADFALDLYRADDLTVLFTFGTWNSFHGAATGAMTSDGFVENWFECDLYAGVGFTTGTWELDMQYYFYTSPSDAAGTIEEAYFSFAYDDSELLGAWAMHPTAVLAIETGNNAADGGRNGTYLELGIAPGFSFDAGLGEDIEISFPVSVGLSLDNYYEGANGEDDVFGFASVGATASLPLGLDPSWGAWTLSAGVQALFLGDAAASFNTNNDDFEVIATVGISLEF